MTAGLYLHSLLSLKLDAQDAYALAHAYRAEELCKAADELERTADEVEAIVATHYGPESGIGPGSAEMLRMAGRQVRGMVGHDAHAVEAVQSDFFQPGHAYTHRDGSDFRCLTVAPHPLTGELRAFGWHIRNGRHEGSTLDPDDWQQYDGCKPPTELDTARAQTVLPDLGPEGSCTGIALNRVHTQVFNCGQIAERHELHLWRTGLEWFTCRGEAR
jgi:hypothetical protein